MQRIRRFFRRFGKGLNARGYTLMEVAAVVAVTATLTAVALPVVGDKIKDAKIGRATGDVQAIRAATMDFMKDTGLPPFYPIGLTAFPLPKDGGGTYYYVLASTDGVMPAVDGTLGTGWAAVIGSAGVAGYGLIEDQLNDNTPKYPAAGESAWKGPYLPSLKKDPWGNKYLVSVNGLSEPFIAPTGGGTGKAVKAVYVISAGPNGLIETAYNQTVGVIGGTATQAYPFTPGNDDIIARIK